MDEEIAKDEVAARAAQRKAYHEARKAAGLTATDDSASMQQPGGGSASSDEWVCKNPICRTRNKRGRPECVKCGSLNMALGGPDAAEKADAIRKRLEAVDGRRASNKLFEAKQKMKLPITVPFKRPRGHLT
eukprot:g15470.t1